MSRRVLLVANAAAGGGWSDARKAALQRMAEGVLGAHELRWTEGPGHATELARDGAADFDVVAAVGGDGTAHEVVNGLVKDGEVVRQGVAFGLVNAGTGGDLARTLGAPRDLEAALVRLVDGALRPVDAIDVTLTALAGADEVRRTCINVAGLGMNARVVELANASSKRWGGRATFAAATVRALARFGTAPARLEWEENGAPKTWEGELLSAFVANGAYCGGGMWVGRGGSVADGALDLTIIPRLPLTTLVGSSYRLFTGTVGDVKVVSTARVSSRLLALATSAKDILVELDGELSGRLPGTFRVTPNALLVAG